MNDVLNIENLSVTFDAYAGEIHAVRGASLYIGEGEILALVGESGCGKSVMARTILGLNPSPPAHIRGGGVRLCGVDMLAATERERERARGKLAGIVFQDPMTCLNPTMRVGKQMTEALLRRREMTRAECAQEAIRLLELVQIPDAAARAGQYPHEFSGGMRQRAMIAMALACKPRLLIADEPTTALDVTIQLEILRLLQQVRQEIGTAVLLITHDLSVVANLADRIAVMYAGQIVEQGPVNALFASSAHPYTRGLLESLPIPGSKEELVSIPGSPPDLFAPPPGCPFAPRCKFRMKLCLQKGPPMFQAREAHMAACWRLHPEFPDKEAQKCSS